MERTDRTDRYHHQRLSYSPELLQQEVSSPALDRTNSWKFRARLMESSLLGSCFNIAPSFTESIYRHPGDMLNHWVTKTPTISNRTVYANIQLKTTEPDYPKNPSDMWLFIRAATNSGLCMGTSWTLFSSHIVLLFGSCCSASSTDIRRLCPRS